MWGSLSTRSDSHRPGATMSNARTWLGRRKFLLSAAAAVASPVIARADRWPSRPVHIICPLAAGGGIDATARIVGARLGDIWGQRVVVENKPGASGNIAAEYAAHAEPDGYTIYIPSFFHTTNAFLVPSHTYDAVADFAPVTLLATYPLVMVVPTSSPARTVQEFIAYARTKKVSFASSGYGSSLHLAAELFTRSAGIEMTHVPYRGAGPAFTDLSRPRRRDDQFHILEPASGATGPAARAGGDDRETPFRCARFADDGGRRRRRRRGRVVVGIS